MTTFFAVAADIVRTANPAVFATAPDERAATVFASYMRANTFGRHGGQWGYAERNEDWSYTIALATGEEFTARFAANVWRVQLVGSLFEGCAVTFEEAVQLAWEAAR